MKVYPLFELDLDIRNLYAHYCGIITDENSLSLVRLLPYAVMYDQVKIKKVLAQMINENKHLAAVYPGTGETATPNMVFIGNIYDGGLYIK